jgi:hypothetical protein
VTPGTHAGLLRKFVRKKSGSQDEYTRIDFFITAKMFLQLQAEITVRQSPSMTHFLRELLTEEFGRSLKRVRRWSKKQ